MSINAQLPLLRQCRMYRIKLLIYSPSAPEPIIVGHKGLGLERGVLNLQGRSNSIHAIVRHLPLSFRTDSDLDK